MRRPFFQEFIISLVLTKKRTKALAIKIDSDMVMMVTRFKNLFLKMSSKARLKNSVIILLFYKCGCFEASLLKVQNMAAGFAHQCFVMGRDNDRCAPDMHTSEKFKDHFGGLFVQASGGLIRQDNLGVADDGPCHRDPLLFAAGQTGWQRFQPVFHAHQPQDAFDFFLDQAFFSTGSLQDQGHIIVDTFCRNQFVVLKYDAEFTAQVRDAVAGNTSQIYAVNQNLPLGYRLSQIKKFEQGGFAGTALPAPLGPLMKTNSFLAMSRVISIRAFLGP